MKLLPAFTGTPELNRIYNVDALTLMKAMPDNHVNCIVTSPPYFGLRDYGVSGQIGLEKTPAEYVQKLVVLFHEARRVLRDDGVLFLNLGDSYVGSGMTGGTNSKEGSSKRKSRMFKHSSDVQHASAYGTSDKAPEDYPNHDCLCGNLCDVCRAVYQNHKSRNDGLLAAMLTASLSLSTREHKGLQTDHPPTSDFVHRASHSAIATQDYSRSQYLVGGRLRASLESMLGLSSPQLLGVCLQRGNSYECLLCARSLVDYAQGYADKSPAPIDNHSSFSGTQGLDESKINTSSIDGGFVSRSVGKICDCSYPYYTTTSRHLEAKNLLLIPARVAIALQEDGWICRMDVIWHKPNPMPESVTDRPTKAHEYVYMFVKSPRYWYDAEAIKEPAVNCDPNPPRGSKAVIGQQNAGNRKPDRRAGKGRFEYDGKWNGDTNGEQKAFVVIKEFRNKRSVWTVPTQPYSGAHFATFPPALIEPMILAGCPRDGIVLDPFMGSGTTALVARALGRQFSGCELNSEYVAIANERLNGAFTVDMFDMPSKPNHKKLSAEVA